MYEAQSLGHPVPVMAAALQCVGLSVQRAKGVKSNCILPGAFITSVIRKADSVEQDLHVTVGRAAPGKLFLHLLSFRIGAHSWYRKYLKK